MKKRTNYNSFNENKSIEELLHNMLQFKKRLEEVIIEYKFYKNLLEASIYKLNAINLFERLEEFKKDINTTEKEALELLQEIKSYSNLITNKIECEDLVCDNFFIKIHDELENKIYELFIKNTNLKLKCFQYLESVLKAKE
jgi:hypothetical protein